MKELHTNIWKADQSLMGAMYTLKAGRRYETAITRNAYDFQSHATVKLWDGNKWNLVYKEPIEDLPIADHKYVAQEGTWEADMKKSLIWMLNTALIILEGG